MKENKPTTTTTATTTTRFDNNNNNNNEKDNDNNDNDNDNRNHNHDKKHKLIRTSTHFALRSVLGGASPAAEARPCQIWSPATTGQMLHKLQHTRKAGCEVRGRGAASMHTHSDTDLCYLH